GKPPCEVHIMKKCGHKYYWVPCDAGEEFLKLCMQTTFQRGTPPPPPNALAAYTVTIKDVFVNKDNESWIVFEKKSVPRGPATMILELKDQKKKITQELEQEEGKNFPQGELTDRFRVTIEKNAGFTL